LEFQEQPYWGDQNHHQYQFVDGTLYAFHIFVDRLSYKLLIEHTLAIHLILEHLYLPAHLFQFVHIIIHDCAVLHLFQLFLNSIQLHRNIFHRDSHDLRYLLITHVFEPKQHDSTIEGLEFADSLMQEVGLPVVSIIFVEEVNTLQERQRLAALFFAVDRDTGVQAHSVNPCTQVALALKGVVPLPQLDEHLLEEVVYFLLVVREHVAHGVDGALLFPDYAREVGFFVVHFGSLFCCFCSLDAAPSEKLHSFMDFFKICLKIMQR